MHFIEEENYGALEAIYNAELAKLDKYAAISNKCLLSQAHTADFYRCDRRFLFFPVAAHSRLLSLLETISEVLLRETFL